MDARWRRLAVQGTTVLLAALLGAGAHAADAKTGVVLERAAVEDRYAARERECRTRFVVTACIDAAKRERRRALDQLREQQLKLDAAQRRERAAERRKAIAEKAAEVSPRERQDGDASGPAGRAPGVSSAGSGHGSRSGSEGAAAARVRKPPRPTPPPTAKPRENAAERARREAAERAAYDERRAAAERHRQASLEATARRAAAGKPPPTRLPVPGRPAASTPGAAGTAAPQSQFSTRASQPGTGRPGR